MRYIHIWAAVVIIMLTLGTVLLFGGKHYYPVVRAQFPDGVTLTFIEQPWGDAGACKEENDKAVAAIRARCAQCTFELVSCPQKLEAAWEDAINRRPIKIYVVHTETQRILIEATSGTAQQICIGMAQQITQQKKQRGQCVLPYGSPS